MKYCTMCGVERKDNAIFCTNCGNKFTDNNSNNKPVEMPPNQDVPTQTYGQPYPCYIQPPKKNMKPIIAIAGIIISIIVVLAILIASGVFNNGILGGGSEGLGGIGESGSSSEDKIPVAGGPMASLQSIATGGNALTTPDISHTAVYGYYLMGEKIGRISFTNIGEEYYEGELCNKIVGSGAFNFDIYSQDIGMSFDIEGYESVYDASLMYCNYDFTVGYGSFSIDMQGNIDVDKYNNEITTTVYSSFTGTLSTVISVSEDFWTKTSLQDNLYVGYTNEITYTASAMGIESSINLIISVTGQEDITVGKGTFEDCYVVKIDQVAGDTITTSYMWIDENDVCPKMQISNSAVALGYGDLTIELEEYYTT